MSVKLAMEAVLRYAATLLDLSVVIVTQDTLWEAIIEVAMVR